jgi:cytochrome c oxidase assembly protein Cox11
MPVVLVIPKMPQKSLNQCELFTDSKVSKPDNLDMPVVLVIPKNASEEPQPV